MGHTNKKNSKNGDFKHGIQLDSYWIMVQILRPRNGTSTKRGGGRLTHGLPSSKPTDRPYTDRATGHPWHFMGHGPTELELHFACGLKNIPATAANKVWKYDRYCFFSFPWKLCVCVLFWSFLKGSVVFIDIFHPIFASESDHIPRKWWF